MAVNPIDSIRKIASVGNDVSRPAPIAAEQRAALIAQAIDAGLEVITQERVDRDLAAAD
jgi:hypothetical protein